MKKTIVTMGLGMAGGMAIAAYMMANPKTKDKAKKMVETAMDDATLALDDMKTKLKQK